MIARQGPGEFRATRLAVICCPDETAQESGFLDRPAIVWDPDWTVCDHVDLANTVILPRRAHARRRRRRARCVALGQPVGTPLHAHDFTSRVRRVGRVGQPCIALDFTPGGLCHESAGLLAQEPECVRNTMVGLYCSTMAPHVSQLALSRIYSLFALGRWMLGMGLVLGSVGTSRPVLGRSRSHLLCHPPCTACKRCPTAGEI
jgi:hypothetical protein